MKKTSSIVCILLCAVTFFSGLCVAEEAKSNPEKKVEHMGFVVLSGPEGYTATKEFAVGADSTASLSVSGKTDDSFVRVEGVVVEDETGKVTFETEAEYKKKKNIFGTQYSESVQKTNAYSGTARSATLEEHFSDNKGYSWRIFKYDKDNNKYLDRVLEIGPNKMKAYSCTNDEATYEACEQKTLASDKELREQFNTGNFDEMVKKLKLDDESKRMPASAK